MFHVSFMCSRNLVCFAAEGYPVFVQATLFIGFAETASNSTYDMSSNQQ
jgi:hypothetical protein